MKLIFAICISACLTLATRANTYTVTSTVDHPITGAGITVNSANGVITGGTGNGLVTLRSAVAAANAAGAGPHIINLSAATYILSISGGAEGLATAEIDKGDLDVTVSGVTIQGAGMNSTIISQTSGDARVLDVNVNFIGSFHFTIDGVTIQGGRANTTGNVEGGGIFSGSSTADGLITVTNCKFLNNQQTGAGLGGGALCSTGGGLTVTNCIFGGTNPTDFNKCNTTSGGAISYDGFATAGVFNCTNSTFTNNIALSGASGGGAINVAAVNLGSAAVTITGCTFTGNSAPNAAGGAISNESVNVTVTKCTFINNSAISGGAVKAGGGTTTVNYCRLVGNTATSGSGFAVAGASVTFNGENNWWGINTGPGANGAFSTGGATMTVTKWLQLKHSANPSSVVVSPPGSSTLTASFLTNSANEAISTTNLTAIIGLPITFNNAVQGSLSAAQTTIQPSGTATATYTVFATACPPSGSADATVDNATVTATITIIDNIPPTVSCPPNKTVSNELNVCGASVALDASAADNCPGAFVNYKIGATAITSPHFFPVGTTTVTAQAQDASGNLSTSTCSFTVTVNDTQVPAINCTSNKTVNTDNNLCTFTNSGVTWNATGSDNCTTINFAYSLSGATTGTGTTLNGIVFNKGITTVKWTATDGSNNTSTCSFTVTVNDHQNPTVNCTTDKTVNTDNNLCTYTHSGVSWDATGSDNCTTISFAYSLSGVTSGTGSSLNGKAFNKGVTTVKWTATDGSSNTATCSFTVTVNDAQAPTISCPANKTVSNALNLCTASISLDATPTDNCPGAFAIYKVGGSTITNPSTFPVGVTTVVTQAQDATGNLSTSTCSFTVTVNDTQAPGITSCPGTVTVSTDANLCAASNVVIGAATATDNCGTPTVSGVRNDALPLTDPYPKGNTTIKWTATDGSGNTATCSQTITVNDVQAPTITSCPQNISVSTDESQCYATVSVGTATASDNCAGTTVAGVRSDAQLLNATYPKGITTIIWTATDASGKTATCSQTVTVNDTQGPAITCPSNIVATENPSGSGSASVSFSVTATDNCSPPPTVVTKEGATVITSPHTFNIGTHTINATATDATGNTSTCSFTITVNPACQITCPTVSPVSNDEGQCGAIVTYSDATTTGSCGTLTYSHPSGSFFNVGTTTVTVTSTSTAQTCQFTVTVNDTEFPEITSCPDDQKVNTANNVCTASVSFAATATDNCQASLTVKYYIGATEIFSGHNFPIGTSTVIVKATDGANNQTTCSFDVTVEDHQNPSVTPPSDKTFYTGAGAISCSRVVSVAEFGVASSSDNCGTPTVQILGVPAGNVFPVGNTILTYKATDGSGNTATAQQTITVVDNTPPVVTCPGNITVYTGPGSATCDQVANWTAPTTSDNCGTVTKDTGPATPSGTFPIGTTTVTYSFKDAAGNVAGCSFTVTVIDNTPPVITCPATQTIYLGPSCTAYLPNYVPSATRSDNCTLSGSITVTQTPAPGTVSGPPGPITVTLKATDGVGNTSSCSFTVNKVDNTPPSINCPGTQTLYLGPSCSATLPNYTSLVTAAMKSDNCTGPAAITVTQSPAPATPVSGTGSLTVTLTATDGAGNTNTCSFTVNKVDNTPPTITCPATQTLYLGLTCTASLPDYTSLPTASDNCTPSGSITITQSPTAGTTVTGSGSLMTVTLKATDASGNTAACSFDVSKVDNTPPVISCPAPVSVNAAAGQCSAVVSVAALGVPTRSDNCTVSPTVSASGVPAGNVFPVGTTNVIWKATDAAGNTATCVQTVTVNDNQPPTFTTPVTADKTNLWPPNHKMSDVITLSYQTSDNCGGCTPTVSVTSNQPINGTGDGDTSPDWEVVDNHHVKLRAERANHSDQRVYTITVTCTDASGNTATSSCTVIVAHNITTPLSGKPFIVGSTVNFNGVFWDKPGNKHTAQWLIDDNTIAKATVTEPSGTKNGKVTGSYKFTSTGVYRLQMNVTDQNRVTSYCNTNEDLEEIIVIYDPNGGFAYGGGWFNSPTGALKSNPAAIGKVSYGFAVNYYKGATLPKGETQFKLEVGNFEYNALNFDYLSVSGANAVFKGSGKIIGGQSGINFFMSVIDGQLDGTNVDKARIKIYNKNTGQIYYDNEPGASEAAPPTTPVGDPDNSTIVVQNTVLTTQQVNKQAIAEPTVFDVRANPNPSNGNFNIYISSNNRQDKIKMQVVDMYGRIIEARNVYANQTIQLGDRYRPGTYIVKLMQGRDQRQLKLIKMPN